MTVVEVGGFSAAARRIGESPSAISKSVSALEKRLGVQLLNPSTRSVTLTDHGRNYMSRRRRFSTNWRRRTGCCDASFIWPNPKFISARVRRVTGFFALALAERF